MSVLLRRKRLPDGTFGELEKVFDGETDAERMARLEAENASLSLSLESVEALQAEMLLMILSGGNA